jgi:hypothetical protein
MKINIIKIIIAIIIFLGFDGCHFSDTNNNQSASDNLNNLPPLAMSGQLYYFAPELDSIKGQAIGYCDCCSSHLLFLNDTEFVAVGYCIGSDTYYKGTYKVNDNTISFQCDSLRVDKETNWEAESDTTNKDIPAFFVNTRNYKMSTFRWTRFEFKGKTCFYTDSKESPYATPNNEVKSRFIKETKQDSVWDKLEIN